MKKIAIIGTIHEDGCTFLKKQKFDIFEITNLTTKNLIEQLKDVDGIILRTAKLDEKILSKCNKLKIIARHGVGYDNVDLNFINKNKVALAITGKSNAASVAEHVITMFLYLIKKINKSDELLRKGRFEKRKFLPDTFELYKKNVLILGYGRIGQAVAKRLLGFETKVYVFDPFVDEKIIKKHNCHKVTFNKGISTADFITIHMPLNDKTKNLISKNQFSKMKQNCIIVNTARGGIINENDLKKAIENNRISGAGLDVFAKEPPEKNHPLFDLDNIVLTPHNAALTLECRKRMSMECAENIYYYFKKFSKLNLTNIVNKQDLNL